MTMELVLCMSRLKPRNLSMLRGFYQTQHPSSKTFGRKEENDYLPAKTPSSNLMITASSRQALITAEAPNGRSCWSNRSGCFYRFDRSTTFAFGRIRVLCQLGHIGKERIRLANEKSHVCQELESTHGDAFRVRWPNDRNNGKASIQERTWLWHDQGLVEELVLHLQITKLHSNARYRIDGPQGRRITGRVRPCLEVHGLGRANADEDTQHFHIGGPLRQRRVKTAATLFNGWEVETRGI